MRFRSASAFVMKLCRLSGRGSRPARLFRQRSSDLARRPADKQEVMRVDGLTSRSARCLSAMVLFGGVAVLGLGGCGSAPAPRAMISPSYAASTAGETTSDTLAAADGQVFFEPRSGRAPSGLAAVEPREP